MVLGHPPDLLAIDTPARTLAFLTQSTRNAIVRRPIKLVPAAGFRFLYAPSDALRN
jgi:hypothetical protein